MSNPLYNRDIISINDLSKEDLLLILNTAATLKKYPNSELLKNKVIASCFFEASTRTRLSFETAIWRMGASVVGFSDTKNTSSEKGETLADTISVISTYTDAIIIRHPQAGSAKLAAMAAGRIPVINAGDGGNEHPTQTLLDLFSIRETQHRLDHLNIAMSGDLKYGRTVHSLTLALAKFPANRFFFVAPDELAMPSTITDKLDAMGINWQSQPSLEKVIPHVDILYMTRMQKERFSPSEASNIKTTEILDVLKLKDARENMRILHPLPRVDEIATAVDKTAHAWYFQQAGNGICTRQALLSLILKERLDT